ncbi:Nucleotidyltransferase family protein OS=Streptomyces tendae OX=1932 GN=GUR47_06665 PE=4 SV=1 [Streptomyces tendae]
MSETTAALRLRRAIERTRHATRERAPVGRLSAEADDVRGTFATDGALGFDPFPFLRALHDAGSHAVVIGQVAGILHGSAELTGDLDLLWDGTLDEARALRDALAACGCTEPPDLDREQVGYRVTGADGDLCTPVLRWGDLDVTPCLARAETTRDPMGFTVRYAALDDLIRMRRALGRPKDHRRADELARLRA